MDEEVLGVYGDLDRNLCAPDMECGDLILTCSASDAAIRFCPRPGPGIDDGGSAADVAIEEGPSQDIPYDLILWYVSKIIYLL